MKVIRSIKDCQPDTQNANRHTARGTALMETSIREYGYGDSMTVDKHGRIISGNQRAETLADLHMTDAIVVQSDGTKPIIHQRTDLDLETDPRAKGLALAQNRVGQVNLDWDVDVLKSLEADGVDLSNLWHGDELAYLLGTEPQGGRTDPDEVPAERATDINAGDLFELGKHRLLCSDCTVSANVARVMGGEKAVLCATDPPYGVDFKSAKYNPLAKHWKGIDGDKRQGTDLRVWLGTAIATWLAHIEPDAAFYFWTAAMSEGAAAAAAVQDAGLHIQSHIVWVKNYLVLGQADYHWRHENCWYAFKKGAKHRWFGDRDKTTVWEVERVANSKYEHPMQKPVELFLRPLQYHTHENELCFEPFAGSGSQIIAAEQFDRRCAAIELNPSFCQVIIDRWEAFTGQKAVKVGEAVRA